MIGKLKYSPVPPLLAKEKSSDPYLLPSISLALQTQQTPPLHEKGTSSRIHKTSKIESPVEDVNQNHLRQHKR